MSDDTGDGRLARKAARGDPRARTRIVRENYEPVWKTLRRFTGDREAADSLTQEAFLRAFLALPGFRGGAALRTWITRIGLNLALNERRRRREAVLPEADRAGPAPGPEHEAERREARDLLRDAIGRLPEDLREALLLTAFAGATHAEAGRQLGCATGTVSWRVFEARRRLREALPDGL